MNSLDILRNFLAPQVTERNRKDVIPFNSLWHKPALKPNRFGNFKFAALFRVNITQSLIDTEIDSIG